MLHKISISNKCCSFELCSSNNLLQYVAQEMFLEQQISILEWVLKDHVALKTGVMMLKIQHWHHRNNATLLHTVNSVFAPVFIWVLQYW